MKVYFSDLSDGDEAIVVVRRVEGGVGLTVSKRSGSDAEVFIPFAEAK